MTPEDYTKGVLVTEPDYDDYQKVRGRLTKDELTMLRVLLNRFVHITNQLDMFKKKIFYGSNKTRVLDELAFAKQEHGYLYDHLSSNYFTQKNLSENKSLRLLHSVVGIAGEAGELVDAVSKYLRSGKLDEVNLKEEFGDLSWYQAIGQNALNTNYGEVFATNNKKLKARYGSKFSEKSASNRNLEIERQILEQKGPK